MGRMPLLLEADAGPLLGDRQDARRPVSALVSAAGSTLLHAMTDCSVCGGPVAAADLESVRDYRYAIARSQAAEQVADSLWMTVDALRDLLRRRGEPDEDDLTSWEEERFRESLDELRNAQQAFKAAGTKARG